MALVERERERVAAKYFFDWGANENLDILSL